MRFSIVKNKSGQVPPQSSCDFLQPGGTIGRSVDNNLVLPDEERAISRLQAIVHISAEGECRITNRGNVTSVQLNNIPLERGRQVELQDGDILGIDDYQIQVNSLQQSVVPVPASVASPAITRILDIEPTVTSAEQQNTAAVPNEIWDSLIQEFTPEETTPTPATYNDELHPLLDNPRVELNPSNPLEQLTDSIELHHLHSRQTDPSALFNSDTPFARDHILADTTPSALLVESHLPKHTPEPTPLRENRAGEPELDPLALFGSSHSPVATGAQNNHDPLGLMTSHVVPLAEPLSPAPERPVAPTEPILTRTSTPLAPARQETIVSQPVAPVTAPEQPKVKAQITPATSQTRLGSRLGIDPVAYSEQQPPSAPVSNGEILEGPLLKALLQGLGLDDLQSQPHLDEQQLQQVGRLLSLFSQGTVALLSSRSILKRGVKAEMTMILDEANNPFKLLPSGKTVLMQMFGSKMPGFMPPEQSVRDALIDLQAHQLGMIAGIQALIAAILQSFNPERLEDEARHEGAIPRLTLPSSRKAALWDYFVKSYQKTAGELEDDFHTLFGEAFLHAYGIEVNQYKDSQTKSGSQ
ncbi:MULTISPECIES: type VI secretion system-associated FHA domain protein TagH [unclassified Serratia (in: enterobacteria)]|uniref:type VI secretion system-associated FHA domain protein TagH n=1 Tax=unclassified Serratia (in: enterobacteria) TaxID=2647522 RepID=UPI000505FDC4|nr:MULTISPECIES: type VI secretion system-associated FHA domain protein TagH [unclassified Serratia (in: enterobacteria)]KFK97904.1 signal peptide protein [Serratia sp. Ag2]KFL00295.1 signal peptide protein [Serratia sp. Ag1]